MAKGVALAAALGLHGTVLWALMDRESVDIEGSAGAQEARIGTSFADMVAGVTSPEQTTETLSPEVTETPTGPERAEAETAPLEPTQTAALTPVVQAVPDIAQTVQTAQPVTPDGVLPVAPKDVADPEQTDDLKQESPTEPQQVQQATEDAVTAITTSVRPRKRSQSVEEAAAKARPKPRTAIKAQPKKKQGNAKKSARAGSTGGTTTAKATQQGGAGTARQQGSAAASNYPGLVMRKLSRVPRPSVGSRGTAVVAFSISSGGGLASVSLARSSGNARLDKAALQVVRRAAPFPKPPAGARRSFSVNIKGR